jgi:hypothetical protein
MGLDIGPNTLTDIQAGLEDCKTGELLLSCRWYTSRLPSPVQILESFRFLLIVYLISSFTAPLLLSHPLISSPLFFSDLIPLSPALSSPVLF